MGRFATSFIAISVVLCTLPLEQLRLYGMQDSDSAEVNTAATEGSSDATSASETPAGDAASEPTSPPADAETPAKATSEVPSNPASPPPSGSLNANSSSNASTNGSTSSAGPAPSGSGDGAKATASSEAPSMGPADATLSVAPAQGTNKDASFSELFFANPLNLILLAFVALYVFLLFIPKPGAKERKLQQQRLASLKKNDRVVLTSGIHGIVSNISAENGTVTVRVDESSNAKLTVDRSAIRSVEA